MKSKLAFVIIYSLLLGILLLPVKAFPLPVKKLRNSTKNPDAGEPPKFALLIGINKYNDKKIRSLEGCENDVKLMRSLLTQMYNFNPATGVKELLSSSQTPSEQPTQKSILAAFNDYLIANAEKYYRDHNLTSPDKGATIVFYYSGHGSYLPDLPGGQAGADGTNVSKDELDGQDETIVPMDSTKDGARDIRDDKFDELFNRLRKVTSNITFIFDSCHSGTITRDGKGTRRSIERLTKSDQARGDGVAPKLTDEVISAADSYVTVSGSLPNETSQETALEFPASFKEKLKLKEVFPALKTNNLQIDGYLTFFLVQELISSPDSSYRDVMQRVKSAVNKNNELQHPQAEGDIDRTFFGSRETRGRTPILIKGEPAKSGRETIFTIDAGRIVGAYPGGNVDIYAPNILEGSRQGSGEIIESDNFEAKVKVSGLNVPKNAKIVLTTPFFGNNKRRVALDLTALTRDKSDIGAQMIGNLSEQLRQSIYLEPKIIENPLDKTKTKDWDVAVVRSTFKEFRSGNRQAKDISLPEDEADIYYLSDPNGNPVYNFWIRADEPEAGRKINEALEKFVRVDNLKNINNGLTDLNSGLKIELVRVSKASKKPAGGCEVVDDAKAETRVLSPGDIFYLKITNNTPVTLYPYIYDIAPDGSISLLYPPRGAEEAWKNGVAFSTSSKCIVYSVTKSDKTSAPFGTETFKLIASTQPFEGSLLTSPAIAREVGRRGGENPLSFLLAQATTNQPRSGPLDLSPDGWATASLNIEIKEN